MYFKCKTGKISVQQLTLATAIQSLFHKQAMDCIVTNLEPMTFELKNNIPEVVAKRLLANMVPTAIQGYVGEIKENKLVVTKEEEKLTES